MEPTQDSDAPWKLVGVKSKVQFTCGLKEVPVSGRADFKAIKTVIRCVYSVLVLKKNEVSYTELYVIDDGGENGSSREFVCTLRRFDLFQ